MTKKEFLIQYVLKGDWDDDKAAVRYGNELYDLIERLSVDHIKCLAGSLTYYSNQSK